MAAAEQTLHRYELLERIAAGGMAEVFRAKAQGAHGFEKVLAIKRILPALAADEEFVARFIAEAKLAVELSHANIVQVFDFGRFGGSLYIAMEFVDGADLATLLHRAADRKRPIPQGVALYIATEIAKALDYAHRKTDAAGVPRGIVHRDVSPSNVLVSYEGEVKLADFGIATAAASAATERRIMGKWRYMSPEQTEGKPLSPASDLFSAATVFYELLTGRRLFPGSEIPEIVRNVREMPIPPPTRVRPDLPEDLDPILLRALERDPARRTPSMKELLAELHELGYAHTLRPSAMDAAVLVRDLVPRAAPSGERLRAPRPLDEILRSELGLDHTGAARLTAPPAGEEGGPATFVRGERGPDGLSVWDIARAPTVASASGHRRRRLAWAAAAVAALLAASGAAVLARRSPHPAAALSAPTAAPAPCVLEIASRPAGAEVSIDGQMRLLRTPGKVLGLAPGQHRIALKLAGYAPWEKVVEISANTLVEPDLRPLPAQLRVEVEPAGAEVFVDGVPAGAAPLARTVAPGSHVVRAQKRGFGEARQTLEVGAGGAVARLRLEPERRWGTVDLFSEPWGEIYLDGKDTGRQTPQRGLRLTAGRHRLRLINPELKALRELEFDLAQGERKLLRETLQPGR